MSSQRLAFDLSEAAHITGLPYGSPRGLYDHGTGTYFTSFRYFLTSEYALRVTDMAFDRKQH